MRCSWVTSVEELSDIENDWEALRAECGSSIFTSHYLNVLWLKSYQDVSPRILVVWDSSGIVGIAPLAFQEEKRDEASFRTLTYVAVGKQGKLRFNHMGILCKAHGIDVLANIVKELRKAEWDAIQLRFMPEGPITREFLSRLGSVGHMEYYPATPTITCQIPQTGDVTSRFGKKTKKNNGRLKRLLERQGRVELRSVQWEQADKAVEVYAQEHIDRWREKRGSMFSDPCNVTFLKLLVRTSLEKKLSFMYELIIDGQIAAQEFGLYEGELVRFYRSGMNNQFAHYSPGILLMMYEMERLREEGIKAFNLGRGGEAYKMHLGGETRTLIGMKSNKSNSLISHVFGPRH